MGTTLTNQNSIHEEMKSRLKSGNVWYRSVQNILSASLLSKEINTKIYVTVNLPAVSYGCEVWSLTLREAHRLRVFKNRVLKREEISREWRRLHNGELYELYSSSNIIRVIKSRIIIIWAGYVAWMGRVEMCTGFWWGDLMERDHLENLDVDGRV
jgi:hypothetical protein